jgi:hypothetical protein
MCSVLVFNSLLSIPLTILSFLHFKHPFICIFFLMFYLLIPLVCLGSCHLVLQMIHVLQHPVLNILLILCQLFHHFLEIFQLFMEFIIYCCLFLLKLLNNVVSALKNSLPNVILALINLIPTILSNTFRIEDQTLSLLDF